MPLLRNKNQPYFPDPDAPNNYNCGGEQYCHPVQVGDTVMSQFYQTPCNNNEVQDPEFDDFTLGTELVTNGTFTTDPAINWTLGAGFTWDNINDVIDATAVNGDTLQQTGLGLTAGKFYRVTFDVTITQGDCLVLLGYGDPLQSSTPLITQSGNYAFDLQFNAVGFENITFFGGNNFTGTIDNVTVQEITFADWEPNDSWNISQGAACHVAGTTGLLEQIVAPYIDANDYYKFTFTVTNYGGGQVRGIASTTTTDWIEANGTYTFWLTPTVNGVVSFEPSIDFVGCISDIKLYKLRNDYSAELINANGSIVANLTNNFSYYQDYVTLQFQFDDFELPSGCYRLKVYDQCIIASDNLVFNGDFVNGYDFWTRNNSASQYSITGNVLRLIFSPFTVGATDYITNGDFSSGSGWSINAGWSVAGGKAIHTPGNTGTMFQNMTLPAPPAPAISFTYTVGFTVTNWTAGTINVKLGNDPLGTNFTWKGNDTFIQFYNPRQSGSVDIVFTPSSNFDGEIDNVACVANVHSATPIITNANNPLYTPGTYQVEWDNVASSDARISARAELLTALPSIPFQTGITSHSFTQNYNANGGQCRILGNFNVNSPDYPQQNKVVGWIEVDNISVIKIEPFEATYETECLQYDENGFERSKMIVGWCDQEAFGFEFNQTGFRLQQRAIVRSIAPVYPKQSVITKSGTGNARVAYAEIEKYWQLHTDFASETFHDAMSAIVSCDHFQIGDTEGSGVEYVAEAEDYTPLWQGDGSYSLATAVVNLRVKNKGQVFNRHL